MSYKYEPDDISQEDIMTMNKMFYNKSMLTGKIHKTLEDPISQLFYDISDIISPTLYSIGITPNFVTTTRFLMIIIALPYFFYNKKYDLAAMIYIIAYYFDCLDGHMARKYNLDTEFGDYYDHIADCISFILSIYIIVTSLGENNKWIILLIIFVGMLSIIQISCQERYLKIVSSNIDSSAMGFLSFACPDSLVCDDDVEKTMGVTKLFGIGTFQLFITLLIWNFKSFE